MRNRALIVVATALLAACGGTASDDTDAARADTMTMTREQRDSAVGASGLPGAGAVNRARDASSAAAERAARLDSMQP